MFEYRTEPFKHQSDELQRTWEKRAHGLHWDMGCGKSKVIIDNFVALGKAKRVSALVVLAPNGVHRNWTHDEVPTHIPKRILERTLLFTWFSRKAKTKEHRSMAESAMSWAQGPTVVSMSYPAVMTKAGHDFLKKFMTKRRCLLVADESQFIKTPGAKTTMRVRSLAGYAEYRRILTGTMVTNTPFDVYSQLAFLASDVWSRSGMSTFAGFKTAFGVFRMEEYGGRVVPKLEGYRNLDRLRSIVGQFVSRVRKDEVLDLPPKIYQKRYFDLPPSHRRVYDELRDNLMTILDSGDEISVEIQIVLLLRLQQVTSGYLPTEDGGGDVVPISDEYPRIKLLLEVLSETSGKTIIWAKHRPDIDQIMQALVKAGRRPVRYDGAAGDDERAAAIEGLQRGDATDFVGNPQAAGTGLTLTAATTVIYYNTSFRMGDRLQSEDRAHRIGQEHPVNYVDLIASNTVDGYIVRSLRKKRDVAAEALGDEIKEWI